MVLFIYALELAEGKYYIGKTANPAFRMEQHFQSNGSVWTRKYRPLRVIEIIPDCDDYDEDKYTRKYMDVYGVDNVRGGSFCEEILEEHTRNMLEKMSRGTQNKCFQCGEIGHFAKDCLKHKKPENIEECLTLIEKYMQEKKALETVNPHFTYEAFINPNRSPEVLRDPMMRGWGGDQQERLKKEEQRAKLQKERNEECFPLIEVFCNVINFINQKI